MDYRLGCSFLPMPGLWSHPLETGLVPRQGPLALHRADLVRDLLEPDSRVGRGGAELPRRAGWGGRSRNSDRRPPPGRPPAGRERVPVLTPPSRTRAWVLEAGRSRGAGPGRRGSSSGPRLSPRIARGALEGGRGGLPLGGRVDGFTGRLEGRAGAGGGELAGGSLEGAPGRPQGRRPLPYPLPGRLEARGNRRPIPAGGEGRRGVC